MKTLKPKFATCNLQPAIVFWLFIANCLLPTAFVTLSGVEGFSQGGTWTQKADYLGGPRGGVVGFAIGTKGYYAFGWQFSNYIYYKDLWEWDQPTNVWTQKASLAGNVLGRGDASGFSIGNKGYVGTGFTGNASFPDESKFWEWDQASNTWTQTTNYNTVMYCGRSFAVGFSIANKGYIGTGYSNCGAPATGPVVNQYLVEWNPATSAWTQKASLPGVGRGKAVGISIGNKGYIGTGEDQNQLPLNDWWEWDPGTDSWTQKATVPGLKRMYAAGFSIGADGYLGTGWDGVALLKDFYRYTPATNTWAQMTDYPHPVCDVDHATFNIGCKGYFGCGATHPVTPGTYFNDFWEYTPPGVPVAAVSGNTAICIGQSATLTASGGTSYSWSTGATTTTIIVQPPPASTSITYSVIVSNGGSCNDYASITVNVLYPPVVPMVSNATICSGQTAALTASGGSNYLWSNGNTNSTINVSPTVTTSYSVTTSNSCGSSTASGTVTVKNCCSVTPVIFSDPGGTVCVGQNVFISASGGVTYSWSTGAAVAYISVTPSVTTTYSVTVTDAAGCTGTAAITVQVDPNCSATGISQLNGDALQAGIWPNPSNGLFHLVLPLSFKEGMVEIYSVVAGVEKIFSSPMQEIKDGIIDLSSQPGGIYFLRISMPAGQAKTGKEMLYEKIVIQKE
ncbi:MAG: hypothetical protein EPN85_02115 [Bacteroidetes bacterium]|nr:MAG: hypothetical protein EPN85_02115 [Bacteroidota bacterium]